MRRGSRRPYISALERQVSAASIDVVERLAKALDVEPRELLGKPEPRRRGE